jgi:hypothetical protein
MVNILYELKLVRFLKKGSHGVKPFTIEVDKT